MIPNRIRNVTHVKNTVELRNCACDECVFGNKKLNELVEAVNYGYGVRGVWVFRSDELSATSD